MRASCRSPSRAWRCGIGSPGKSARMSASGAAACSISATMKRRSRPGHAGAISPAPSASRRGLGHGRGGCAWQGDQPALEGRRLLAIRRHCRSGARRADRGARHHRGRRQRASDVCGPRAGNPGRPRQRRDHGGRARSARDGRAGRRRLGVDLLPPARHPLPAGLGARLHPCRWAGRPGAAGCPAYGRRLGHAPRRWRLYARDQRPRPRRSDAAEGEICARVRADVRAALAFAGARRAERLARRLRDARPLAPRCALADGARAHARSGAGSAADPRHVSARRYPAAGLAACAHHRSVGGLHRQHTRRHPRHQRGARACPV